MISYHHLSIMRIILSTRRSGRWRGPVPENLIVDLHRADTDIVCPHVLPVLNFSEEVLQGTLVYAWVLHTALKMTGEDDFETMDDFETILRQWVNQMCCWFLIWQIPWRHDLPPWCRSSQSQSAHRQRCRHGIHLCRMLQGAQSPETPKKTENGRLQSI